MEWTSEAIITKQISFSDDKLLCWLFSKNNGLYKGLISINKKTRNQIQLGNIVNATWKARLSEHLGTYYCELIKPLSIVVLHNNLKLYSVTSFCSILSACLPERAQETKLYNQFYDYLMNIKEEKDWLLNYLELEMSLLKELGYGLELNSCAVTGDKDNLYYVSPNTGRAVTKNVGDPYHNKLLKLPSLLKNNQAIDLLDIAEAIKFIGFFIDKWLFKQHQKQMPNNRIVFLESLVNNSCKI